jgi:ribonuclease HII
MIIAGVDEVGRGCLAGKVVAAAVVLPDTHTIAGLTDSKKLSPKKRELLATQIQQQATSWAIASASVEEIDQINILQASLLAMQRAVEKLAIYPDLVKADGREAPHVNCPVETIIGGDASVESISAASIIAKVARDKYMCELEKQYPGFGFATHKGYPSKTHVQALQELGVSAVHRRSFKPVKTLLASGKTFNAAHHLL